jgi:hypothetical protein
VLTKLKFDESVNGYALITSDGHPFLSFSLPDEVLPQIKGTLRIHGSDLRLVNTMTGSGTVILARVDPRWVLAVLFEPDFQLGGALTRTKAVVDLLKQVDLPPPPAGIAEEEEVIPLVEEEPIAEMESAMTNEPVMEETTTIEPMVTMPTETPDTPPKAPVEVRYGCVVYRGENYKDSVTLDTKLNVAIKKEFANVGIDILLVVDEKLTVYRLADHLARAVDKVINIVEWCISRDILWVECPEEQETAQKEIIELPLFEGKIDKVKKKHRPVLELCDGRTTLQEIATELGIPYFEALQSVVPYRGKTVKFIRTDKLSRF